MAVFLFLLCYTRYACTEGAGRGTAGWRGVSSYGRDSSGHSLAHSSRRSQRVALTGFLQLSHASRRAAGGSTISPPRYASTSAAHFSCHSSLRTCLPCGAARRCASPPQTRSLLPPPAAVAYLPQNDRKRCHPEQSEDPGRRTVGLVGHAKVPGVERWAGRARSPTDGILRPAGSE